MLDLHARFTAGPPPPPRTARLPAALLALGLAWACVAAPSATTRLAVAGAELRVEFTAADFAGNAATVSDWVRRSAQIVHGYYGRFPESPLLLRIVAEAGDGVRGGTTYANPDAFIRIRLGREVTAGQLQADWVLVHEMTHLALPDTGPAHAWLSEGVATYVEGVARVQAGNRSEADVWAEELRAMPRGLPQAGDQGLDRTHSWGRTYWGGAMFCLLADVEIHQRTGNRLGLQDALRAILAQSGGLSADWPIEKVLRTGDAATGTTALADLYARMKDRAVTPDLAGLWASLGIRGEGDSVVLDDAAPLAPIRRAIMQAR
jgi:hypothetical protein